MSDDASWQKYVYTIGLVGGMLLTGTANTLLNKFQDMQCVENCGTPEAKNFEQPVWQTLNMFVGEFLCLLAFGAIQLFHRFSSDFDRRKDNEERKPLLSPGSSNDEIDVVLADQKPLLSGWKHFLILIPTLCDIAGTTLMNVGLLFISASIYQMLRGAVVIFTGILSVLCLRVKIPLYRIYALVMVLIGVGIVGASPILFPPSSSSEESEKASKQSGLGVAFVLGAQCFSALQFVVEEIIMTRYEITPMKMVGFEGLFGMLALAVGMPILYFSIGLGTGNYFDLVVGYQQLLSSPIIWGSSIGIAFSIAFFNWFGLNVTRFISATSRTTIDTCRTVFIWAFCLALGWEKFIWLQVVGFVVLIYGTFVYNNVCHPIRCISFKRPATP